MFLSNLAYLDPSVVTIAFACFIPLILFVVIPGIVALIIVSSVRKKRKK